MTSISDPARAGRRDRSRAQKVIDLAFGEKRLSAAERDLRTQRIRAAHTKGDLAMITRDLVSAGDARLGSALDPSVLSSMQVGKAASTPNLSAVLSSAKVPTLDLSAVGRKVKWVVLFAVLGFIGTCGLGMAAFIPALVDSTQTQPPTSTERPVDGRPSTSGPSEPAGPTDLHSAAGWSALVDAIEEESGTSSVYDVVLYPTYAAVALDGDGVAERRLYRDGAWQDSFTVSTPAVGDLVDLSLIDPKLIERLPAETANGFGLADAADAYMIINAIAGGPKILVYVQSEGGSQYRSYGLDGSQR